MKSTLVKARLQLSDVDSSGAPQARDVSLAREPANCQKPPGGRGLRA